MALGGGTFQTMNKTLPGTYINFVSAARASSALSDRGIAAVPLALDWGPDGEVFEVLPEDLIQNSRKVFGHDYGDDALLPLREIFCNARVLYTYKLGNATKAANEFATAKYGGTRGNDIRIVIAKNVDDPEKWDVTTLLDTAKIDTQTVSAAGDLQPNDFVDWKQGFELAATAGTPLTGGENGEITGENYQDFLNRIDAYSFHCLGCPTDDESTKELFVAYTKRMRDEVGKKFQLVGHKLGTVDFEGCISVENDVANEGALVGQAVVGDVKVGGDAYALVYWLTGAEAACAVNASCTNKVYDGEYAIQASYTQRELEDGIKAGKLMFHLVDGEPRILEDINTFTSFTASKNSDFSLNQVIRVLDQIANDVAVTFANMFLGKVQNDQSGRVSLWNEIVNLHDQLLQLRAIEDFNSKDIVVDAVENDKRAVVETESVKPVCAMEKLYMTVTVE